MSNVGVFDSGAGGQSVAEAIHKALPDIDVLFRDDREHLPYGTKTPDEILNYVLPILEDMVKAGCTVIVVACNTVSTTLISVLRERISIPLIAVEPMIKPAAEMSKSKIIAVCATPTTLNSERYRWLKEQYARDLQVIEPDCSNWANMVESGVLDRKQIHDQIDAACEAEADVIVLGCTHYHWIENIINEEAAGRATVIQPEKAVIEQLKRVLAQL